MTTPSTVTTRRRIFVFGSNLAGRHGLGAALAAVREHGAVYGQGAGLQGNSYAIPTKSHDLKTLPLEIVARYISAFLAFAKNNPELEFDITRVGCGLAGYKDKDVGPLFRGAPKNCNLPEGWGDGQEKAG